MERHHTWTTLLYNIKEIVQALNKSYIYIITFLITTLLYLQLYSKMQVPHFGYKTFAAQLSPRAHAPPMQTFYTIYATKSGFSKLINKTVCKNYNNSDS